ncbi:MAG: winged helix-turn-helix transcriptional regulator, partial [Candidatus Hodarchaeota archaeon]
LSNQQEFEEKQTGLQAMQQSLQKIRNEEGVLDYLLSDAGSAPSEIDIVAILAQKRQISQRELQEFVSVPPAIIMKAVRFLEEKGILFTSPDGFIRLTKPI